MAALGPPMAKTSALRLAYRAPGHIQLASDGRRGYAVEGARHARAVARLQRGPRRRATAILFAASGSARSEPGQAPAVLRSLDRGPASLHDQREAEGNQIEVPMEPQPISALLGEDRPVRLPDRD